MKWQLLWVALLTPVFLFPPVGKPWLLLIVLLPLPWLVAMVRRFPPLPLTSLNGVLALLAVMVLVSLWATYDISFSAPKVLGVVLGVALFFAIVGTLRRGAWIHLSLDLFVAAGTALACVGLLGTNWIGKVHGLEKITSRLPAVIRGVPGQAEGFQPNAIAGSLVMFIPLQIALVVSSAGGRMRRALHAVALLITGGTLLLTQSRGGWAGLAAGILAWSLWQNRRTRLVAIIAILLAGITLIAGWSYFQPVLLKTAGAGVREDTEGRLELWSRALSGIQDFPLTGMGMNTFRRIMPVLYPAFLSPPDVDVAHAHNHLLQAALDLGLPGLVAYLALWFGAAALLTVAIRHSPHRKARRVVGGLAAGMIACFVFGTADVIALGAKVGIFFWIALALIVAIHDSAVQPGGAAHE